MRSTTACNRQAGAALVLPSECCMCSALSCSICASSPLPPCLCSGAWSTRWQQVRSLIVSQMNKRCMHTHRCTNAASGHTDANAGGRSGPYKAVSQTRWLSAMRSGAATVQLLTRPCHLLEQPVRRQSCHCPYIVISSQVRHCQRGSAIPQLLTRVLCSPNQCAGSAGIAAFPVKSH